MLEAVKTVKCAGKGDPRIKAAYNSGTWSWLMLVKCFNIKNVKMKHLNFKFNFNFFLLERVQDVQIKLALVRTQFQRWSHFY